MDRPHPRPTRTRPTPRASTPLTAALTAGDATHSCVQTTPEEPSPRLDVTARDVVPLSKTYAEQIKDLRE